jgi:hypothetical protein
MGSTKLTCVSSFVFSSQPIGDYHRPTTPAGSKTGLRFSSELTVEVYYGLSSDGEDGAVRVVPLFQRKVELASYVNSLAFVILKRTYRLNITFGSTAFSMFEYSCFCIQDFHDLPNYSDSTLHRLSPSGHPWHIGCACDLPWSMLVSREEAVLQRLQEEADLGMAKRLHHELNSSRFVTKADGIEEEGEETKERGTDGGGLDGPGRCKVGEFDDHCVWQD